MQETQAAPANPWPHCAVVNWLGCRQALPSQQPAQLLALHVVPPLQTPDWQLWPAAESHVWQKPPLRPHRLFAVPATQLPVLMSRQPLQGWQLPLTQVLPIVQLWHALPPAPQREGVVVVMHTPAGVQQPAGQVLGEQEDVPPPPPVPDVTQEPEEEQSWLFPHCMQAAPLRPHEGATSPVRHRPRLSQQPAQVAGEQVAETQAPEEEQV